MRHSLVMLSLVVMGFACQSAQGQTRQAVSDWRYVSSTSIEDFYYNVKTLRRAPNDHVRVWTRDSLTDKAASTQTAVLRNYAKSGIDVSEWGRYSYTLTLWEFDCRRSRNRPLELAYYDDSGSVLDSVSTQDSDWSRMTPDSVAESIAQTVCTDR